MTPFLLVALAVMMPGAGRMAAPMIGAVTNPDGSPASGVEILASGGAWASGDAPVLLGRTTSDGQGGFRLDLADDPAATDRPTLWAFRPGRPVTRKAIGVGAPDDPIRLPPGPPGEIAISVIGPDGRPVAGARIIPQAVADAVVPGALGELVAATTDADGRATLSGFYPEEIRGVTIEAAGFGVQRRRFADADGGAADDARRVVLLATGRVSGRVVSDQPGAAAGLPVRATTVGDDRVDSVVGVAETVTDASGRFELDEVAAGKVTVRVRPRAGSPDLPARVGRRMVRPGQETGFAIPLRRGVRVFGFVREGGEARPVAGAVVSVLPPGLFEPDPVRSDAEGRYETFVPPGAVTYRILRVPAPYLGPPEFAIPRPVVVPDGIAGFELPPISLTLGAEVRGTVVDADGRPVAGAEVEASWTWFDGRTRAPRSVRAASRADGSFAVGPVDPAAELRLSASSGAGVARPVAARASDPTPARLVLAADTASSLAGRVVDADGRPVAGALIRVGSRALQAEAPPGWIASRADAEGRFRTPRLPLDGREYFAVARADGFRPGRARPIRPARPNDAAFPDLVLARAPRKVVLEGRAVDRAGRPIAGVVVWTWGEGPDCRRATTDEAGAFRLVDVAAGPGFLFASREGYRFAGRAIRAGAGHPDPDLVLTRSDEPPDVVMTTRPANPGIRAVARTAIVPLVEAAQTLGDAASRVRVLETFAGIDPARALAMIEAGAVKDPWMVDHLRSVAARGLLAADPDRASAAIASIGDPETRMLGALGACSALPAADRGRRVAMLDRATADADAIRDPAARVVARARIAGLWLDLGEPDRASRLLREARSQAEALPGVARGARARGAFAECLARIDLDGALALIDGLVDPVASDRHRLRIARVRASAHDPQGAEKVFATIRDPQSLAAGIPSLCHAMAPSDPAVARAWIARVGRGGDPCLSPFSLGLMALAIAEVDKPTASDWLREAFDRLESATAAGAIATAAGHDPAVVAAALLPVAERIDPALVPEFFWRAIAIRGPRGSCELGADAALIPLLARYDRPAALVLFEPLAARVRSGTADDPCPVVVAGAALDPDLARLLIAGLPDAPGAPARHPRSEASLALASSLGDLATSARDDLAGLLRLWSVGGLVEP